MTFVIDTGNSFSRENAHRVDKVEAIMQNVLDGLPENATQAQIDDQIVQIVMGDLRGPKRLQTVRRHFLQFWPLIAPIAERDPAQFDAVILELAERITTLD